MKLVRILTVVFIALAFLFSISSEAGVARPSGIKERVSPLTKDDVSKDVKAKVMESYGKLPLYFIANYGQVDKRVKFYEKGSGHSTYFTTEGVYLQVQGSKARKPRSAEVWKELKNPEAKEIKDSGIQFETIKLSMIGANKSPEIIAEGLQQGKVNYFIGNDPR